jgi:hypothetical protein
MYVCCIAVPALIAKLLLALASTVILDSEFHGAYDLILRFIGSGRLPSYSSINPTFWVVTPCSLVEVRRRLGEKYKVFVLKSLVIEIQDKCQYKNS